jgi:integrase
MAILVECPECKTRNSTAPYRCGICQDCKKGKTCKKPRPCKKCGLSLGRFTGKVYWIEYYDLDQVRRRERIGSSKEAAEQRLREVLKARTEGRYIKRRKELKITFNDLAKRYHEWAKVNNKSYAVNKAYFINQLTGHFGQKKLVDITPWLVERWKVERSKRTGFTEIDRELATLKHMFTKGIEWRMTTENPARMVKLFRKTRKRERFLTQDEIARLLVELPDHQRPMIQLALLTGLRRGNLLNLRWGQMDLNHGYLHISAQEAKGGHNLKLPLSPEAVELLQDLPRHPTSEYVFCKENGAPYKYIYAGFKEAIKRAGIEDCTPHTLRHTVGSHLVMAGVDLATVKELLGHQDIQTTLRYAHLAQDHKREAIGKIGKLVAVDTYMDTKDPAKEKGLRLKAVTP